MPTLTKEFLCLLQDDYTKYDIFIETGTYNGSTIFSMEPLFTKLYTIEISEKYYKNTKVKYNGNKINFLLGDSSTVLQYVLPTITEKCIIFLDGHWSGDDTGQGEKDCPLIEEITLINKLCKTEAIIIIDDCRLFGKGPKNGYNEDWSDINTPKLVSILQNRISKTYHLDTEYDKDDRLIIHINAKEDAQKTAIEKAIANIKSDEDARKTAIVNEKLVKEQSMAKTVEDEKVKAVAYAKEIEDAKIVEQIEIEKLKAMERVKEEIEKRISMERVKEEIERLAKDKTERLVKEEIERLEKERLEKEKRISVAVAVAVSKAVAEVKSVARVDINSETEEARISKAVAIAVSKAKTDSETEELRISKAVAIAVASMKTQQECCIIS